MNRIEGQNQPFVVGGIGDGMAVRMASSRVPSAQGDEQPVLDAQSLIDNLGLGNAIPALRIKLAFPAEVFALAARPLIDGHAEVVQMLPVMGSGRLAQPGGQLHRGLETAIRSLDRRRGQILPRGAAPEVIGAQAHRWSYAVFVAALLRDLHGVGKGMRVWMRMGAGIPRAWSPAAGSMRSCGALGYRIEVLPHGVDSEEVDPAMALRLFERCVPALIHYWLGEDPALTAELRACLSGRADPARVITELVARDAPVRYAAPPSVLSSVPTVPAAVPDTVGSARVAPAESTVDSPEFLEEVKADGSALARQFMAWLSQGVLSGTLSVNTSDALLHVVAEGLLLASPRIFREFAKQRVVGLEAVADADKRVQREVLRAGWQLRAGDGANILCYEYKRSGRGPIRINGVVILEPQRFIQRLPAIDSNLVRVVDPAGRSF